MASINEAMRSIVMLSAAAMFLVPSCASESVTRPLDRGAESLIVAPMLPRSIEAISSKADHWQVTFSLVLQSKFASPSQSTTVGLAGSFNGWNPVLTPMVRMGDGVYRVTLELPDATHLYKFVVDGNAWLNDPANTRVEDDGQGGVNSVLTLDSSTQDASEPCALGDGMVDAAACVHDPQRAMWLQGAVDNSGSMATRVRYRTRMDDVTSVSLDIDHTKDGALSIPMQRVAQLIPFDWWEATVPALTEPATYSFTLHDGDASWRDAQEFALSPQEMMGLRTPEWTKHAVWYQIMLDRFRNGDASNDPDPTRPWRSDWLMPSAWEGRDGQTMWQWFAFTRQYGGDITGLQASIPYLRDLGVTAVYLNPVFEGASHHKYDARSFVHIDDNFGVKGDFEIASAQEDLATPSSWTWTASDRAFLALIAEFHQQGMKLIIDGVFNHVGDQHLAFLDLRAQGKSSRFASWFAVKSFDPFVYDGWAGFGQLPVFAKNSSGFASDQVRDHLFAVTRRWMDPNGDGDPSDGVDGWRLDVPNEIPKPFWQQWRTLVKSINPDAFISGEVWTRADEWFDGTTFDAVMNYPFATAALAWIGNQTDKITVSELDRRLALLRLAYPAQASYALMNLLDSHDTDRVASMLKNPDRGYDQNNHDRDGSRYDGSKPAAEDFQRQRLLALLQMTYIGAPMIWYGDEAGMWGSDDPVSRKPMLWQDLEPYDNPLDRVDASHLGQYRAMIALRRDHPALQVGSFRSVATLDAQDVWIFAREHGDQRVLVLLNGSEQTQPITIDAREVQGWNWNTAFVSGKTQVSAPSDATRAPLVDGVPVIVPALGARVLVGTRR